MSVKDLAGAKVAASLALTELDTARELYQEFLDTWGTVVNRAGDLYLHIARQVEAYQPFTRDQGMGDDHTAWFDHMAEQLQDILDTEETPR